MDNQKLGPYDVDSSLYAMMRAAQAKQDKEHMKLCMEEASKRKKALALIMKDMPMEKSQELKKQVADRLAKSVSDKELTTEEMELISIDVMLRSAQLEKSEVTPEAESVAAAAGTEVIADPTAAKPEIKFAGNLFQNFQVGSVVKNSPNGSVLDNAKKSPQDYVANGNKSKNQSYTAEQLQAAVTPKK
jgi:hypothetical protein